MRKFLSLFAAMLIAIVANAAVINIDNTTGDALRLALNNANSGDIIEMAAGTYVESNGDYIAFAGKDVTVRAAEGAEVIIQPQVPVQVTEGGCAHFVNVKIDASRLQELADWYEHLMYPADAAENNRIILEGCELYGFNLNKSMLYCSGSNVLSAITIDNCYIHNNMKSILFVENTSAAITAQVTNSTFANHAQGATDSYWAGIIDLRNANANLLVDHCTFYDVIPMNTDYSCVSKITLANGNASNCIFMLSTAQDGIRAMRGVTATNCITYNYLKDSGTGIHSSVTQNNCIQADPLFVDAANGNFALGEGSPALTMNDGQPIGDPRWNAAAPQPADPTVSVRGTMNEWGETPFELSADKTYATLTIDDIPAGDYQFKMFINGEWRSNGYTFHRGFTGAAGITGNDDNNMVFQADVRGAYTFTWTFANDSLGFVYPEAPQPVDEWAEIKFTEPVAAADIAADATFTVAGSEFALQVTDPDNKMVIDANTARFGTPEAFTDYTHRLKTSGKTNEGVTKNFMTLNIPEAGQLRIAVRTGSNSDATRTLIIKQGETELYNQVVKEDDKTVIVDGENSTNYYPYILVNVAAGQVVMTYPVNGLNFYAIAFKAGAAPQPADPTVSVRGSMNEWGETPFELSADKTYATLVVNDIPAGDYQFKMFINGEWRSNGYTFHRGFTGAAGITGNDDNNMVFQADVQGQYTFTWTFANDSLGFVYPEAPQPSTCDWDNIEYLGGPAEYANQFKVCKPENVGVVNIQQPGWATEIGIYMTFPSAAFGEISLPESAYDVQGAGIIFHLSAFTDEYTEVTVVVDSNPLVFTVYNAAAAPQPVEHTYTVAGSSDAAFGTAWTPTVEANDMVLVEGLYTWEKANLTLAAGNIEFKVCEDHAWTNCWPSSNYILNIPEAGIYTVTITFNADSKEIAASATKTGEAVVIPTVAMHGNFLGSWADTENFTVAEGNATASLTLNIAAGNYEFGMRIGGSGNWTANGVSFTRENASAVIEAGSGNLKLAADVAGDYTFTWTYETNTLAIAFPAVGPVEAPTAAPAAPTYPIYQVKAVYSATYEADCDFGEWGSGTQYAQEEFGKKYVTTAMGYFGITFEGPKALNCSEMEALHLDVWVAADAAIDVYPIWGGAEQGLTKQLVGQQWNAIDIPLTDYNVITNWSNIYQIKIANASNMTLWINNVYFYTTVEPVVDLEDGYYMIGLNGWDIHNITAADKFAANTEAEGEELVIAKTLAEGNEFKVVAVAANAITTWYPGEAGNYVVDFLHAGETSVYFRPNYDGGEDWHAGCIFVPAKSNPWETWFASYDSWNTETESYLEYDEATGKATVHINVDKYGQWRAQVKYHGPVAEEGKCYHVALKLKANNAVEKVTIKWQDKPDANPFIIKDQSVNLAAGVEYVLDETVAANVAGGNGVLVFDFGWAHAGDIIEIYDLVIEETECPEPLEVNYYLVGSMTNWAVVAENQYLFAPNAANEAEYVLSTTLAEGDEFKVVKVEGETQTWMPDGMGNNYVVDAAHAGKVIVYFRPDGQGGDGWHYGYIYVDIDHTGIDNTAVEMKAVKVIRNGQLLIIMGEKTFNAQGQIVK